MSFKQNYIINLGNYEEYFILYMDNELAPEQKLAVENFISQHPQLAEELNILMGLKLPVDEVKFSGKEELFSPAMKENMLDEWLLLYVDNELPAAERKAVAQKINSDKEYAFQHNVLMQTKLNASEKIAYPNKKELYRHTERVIDFKVWMRVAAAVIILLLGSLYFFTNRGEKLPGSPVVHTTKPAKNIPGIKPENILVEESTENENPLQQEQTLVKAPQHKSTRKSISKDVVPRKKDVKQNTSNEKEDVANNYNNNLPTQKDITRFELSRFTTEPQIKDVTIVNNNITYRPVTSAPPIRKTDEDTQGPAVTDGDFKDKKTTRAKGFFRKVSRFIERNTGIGTVNADNELLIGAVSLKLK